MFTCRQSYTGQGTQKKGLRAIHAHAGFGVLVSGSEEAKEVLPIAIDWRQVRTWPTPRGRKPLDQLDQHLVSGPVIANKLRFWLRYATMTLSDDLRRQALSVNGDFVETAGEAIVSAPSQCRANPELVIIHNRRTLRCATHVPPAGDRFSIDVALDAFRFPELVGDGDMRPSIFSQDTGVRGPAVPFAVLAFFRTRKEKKAHATFATLPTQAKSVILVVGRKSLVVRAPLADEIDVVALADHP